MKLRIFPVLLLIFISTAFCKINAQQTGTLRGIAKDSTTSEVLPFCNIFIKELNAGISTNSRGYFVLPSIASPHSYTVIASYVGYKTKEFNIKIETSKITEIEILLNKSSVELGTVEKVANVSAENNKPLISRLIITPRDLEITPMNIEPDLFRSLASLPGVQNSGDVSVKFNVRGGESNQNLILLDGIPIYYPFHAIGLLSVIDPDIINNVEFFKGGFTSNYDRAISSIVKIISNDGNNNFYSGKASLSLLSAKGLIEGPISNGSFYFTGRKSISNKILRKFVNEKDIPIDFYDYSFKINYRNKDFFEGTKFSLINLSSQDNLKYADPLTPDYLWSNNVWGFKMFTVGKIPFFLDLGISLSSFENKINPKESEVKPKQNELNDFTISFDFLYILDSKDEIEIGTDIKSITSKLFLPNKFDFQTDIGTNDIGSNAYINYKILRFVNLGINIGARFNIVDLEAKGNFIEPRINISYKLLSNLSIKTAYGIFQQELTTLQDEREALSLFEPIVIIPSYLSKAKAEHFIAGVSYGITNNIKIDIEGYYKNLISVPTLNENKTLFDEPDLLNSKGESYGTELLFNYSKNPFLFTVSYTLSWAFKEVDGFRYRPKYDSRHNLNLTLSYKLPFNIELNTTWKYNSGYPFTQQAGYYDRLAFNDFISNNDIYNTLIPIQLFAQKNAATLPDYHRLDMSLSKKLDLNYFKINMSISAINIYNRKNIYYFEQSTGKRVNMIPFLVTGIIKIEL